MEKKIDLYHYYSGSLSGGISKMIDEVNQGQSKFEVTARALDHEALKTMIHTTLDKGNPPDLFSYWAGEMAKRPLMIKPIAREVLKLLRSTIPQNIEIRQEIFEDIIPVLGDPTEIYEIIMNLCINTYHAMEKTSGRLTVKLIETQLADF
jgi:hypothetical protein